MIRMGRPREFDEAAVLDAATLCFWERGYEATSVRELADQMGLTGSSLYNAFGVKRALFRSALYQSNKEGIANRVRRNDGNNPTRIHITAFFSEFLNRALETTTHI